MPVLEPTPVHVSPMKPKKPTNIIRTSSVSGHYKSRTQREDSKQRAVHQTTLYLDFNSHFKTTPYCFSPIKSKYSPLPQRISRIKARCPNIPEMIIKGEPKFDKEKSIDKSLYEYLQSFYGDVKSKYYELYLEIDRMQRGNFDLDDVIDFCILKQIDKEDKDYDEIKNYAKELYGVMGIISYNKKIALKHFLGFCSVFEHNKGGNLVLTERKSLEVIKGQIYELKELFECFTNKRCIDVRALLLEVHLKEKITRCRMFVENDKVDFSRFLRCLPFFVWIYNAFTSNLDL